MAAKTQYSDSVYCIMLSVYPCFRATNLIFLSKCTMQDSEFKFMNPESGMNLLKFKMSVRTWPN